MEDIARKTVVLRQYEVIRMLQRRMQFEGKKGGGEDRNGQVEEVAVVVFRLKGSMMIGVRPRDAIDGILMPGKGMHKLVRSAIQQ